MRQLVVVMLIFCIVPNVNAALVSVSFDITASNFGNGFFNSIPAPQDPVSGQLDFTFDNTTTALDFSPDWFLPMMEPEHILRLRELDTSPTKNGSQAPFYGAPAGSVCNFHIWQLDSVEMRNGASENWGVGDGLPASVAYPGNIIVSAFEAIDRENQLVVNSAWGSKEIFIAYRQMRRDTAPDFAQPFLVDDVMVQGMIVDADPRASA